MLPSEEIGISYFFVYKTCCPPCTIIRRVAYLGKRYRPHESVVKRDEPLLKVERPLVEPDQSRVEVERREEVERAAVADDGGVLQDGHPVAVVHHVARQPFKSIE